MRVKAGPAPRPTVAGALAQDAVVVSVGRYVVTLPVCPDWSKPEADDYTNTPPSNFGCANASNLGRMVANPADLVHGTPLGPADGDFAARGIQRYRAGEIDNSIKPELSTVNRSASGGQ
jgi:pilus assembly protein CpaD